MMRKFLILCLCAALLAGCNLPTTTNGGAPDEVATKVSQLLTQAPTAGTPVLMTATPGGADTPGGVDGGPTRTLAASATAQPSNTPVATLTGAPTAAPATPTTLPGDPKNSLGQPNWQTTTETAKSFYLYENEGTRVSDNNGMLVLSGLNNNGWLGWSNSHSHPAQNFYLEATFKTQDCANPDAYGLVFRAPSDEAGYFFTVTCGGQFGLAARNFTDDTNTTLIKLTSNAAITPGANQTNRLGVLANGDKIGLYANGTLLQEITDTTYNPENGFLGVHIAANQTAGFTVRLESIAQWKLP